MSRRLDVLAIIAFNTIRELVRSKLLYNLLVFAVLFIASSMFVAQLTVGQWDRVILDMGLAAIEVSGLLVAVLIGVGLLAGEIDKRTILPTLARPISRGTFLLGRYCGLLAVLLLDVLVMMGVLAGVLHLTGYALSATAAAAAALIFVELGLLAATAMLFSSFSTPILASAFSLSIFLIGHLLSDLRAYGDRSKSELAKAATLFFYRLFPDLELLNLKSQAANELPVDLLAVRSAAVYGLCYTAVLLFLAIFLFNRREIR